MDSPIYILYIFYSGHFECHIPAVTSYSTRTGQLLQKVESILWLQSGKKKPNTFCTLVMSRYAYHHTIETLKFNYTQNVEHLIGCLGPALLFLLLLTRFLHRICLCEEKQSNKAHFPKFLIFCDKACNCIASVPTEVRTNLQNSTVH